MSSKKHSGKSNPSIDPSSQWVDLQSVIKALSEANSLSEAQIRQILLCQDLSSLTPVLDNFTLVHAVKDSVISEITTFVLMEPEDAQHAFPSQFIDFAMYRSPAWPIPSLIQWLKSCKLKLAVPQDWTDWMQRDHPRLRDAGLVFSSWQTRQEQQALQAASSKLRKNSLLPQVVRLKDAPAHLGMNKNRFNSDVRPALHQIAIGKRGVGFHRAELDRWAESQLAKSKAATNTKAQQTRTCHSSNATTYGGPASRRLTENEFAKALGR